MFEPDCVIGLKPVDDSITREREERDVFRWWHPAKMPSLIGDVEDASDFVALVFAFNGQEHTARLNVL